VSLAIDWTNHQILVETPQTTVLVQDLIDFIREQEETDRGIAEDQIATASGKEELGTDVYVGISVNLIDPWQIKFWPGNYIATVKGGNLVGGVAGDPVAYSAGVQVLIIQSAASTIVDGSGGLTTEEHDAVILGSKVVKNKKELKKNGSVWELIVYDDDGTTPILNKALKDKDSANITDLVSGTLAKELASSV
jgi:hypothetical protein